MLVADPYADDMKAAAIEVPVVSFAMQDREADVYAERVKYSVWETEILIRTPLGKLQARAQWRRYPCAWCKLVASLCSIL